MPRVRARVVNVRVQRRWGEANACFRESLRCTQSGRSGLAPWPAARLHRRLGTPTNPARAHAAPCTHLAGIDLQKSLALKTCRCTVEALSHAFQDVLTGASQWKRFPLEPPVRQRHRSAGRPEVPAGAAMGTAPCSGPTLPLLAAAPLVCPQKRLLAWANSQLPLTRC